MGHGAVGVGVAAALEEYLEISSDTALLGSQRDLKDPLSRQTRAIKLQSSQKFIRELWRDGDELDARGRQKEVTGCILETTGKAGVQLFTAGSLRTSQSSSEEAEEGCSVCTEAQPGLSGCSPSQVIPFISQT